jgi:hypothetical protein
MTLTLVFLPLAQAQTPSPPVAPVAAGVTPELILAVVLGFVLVLLVLRGSQRRRSRPAPTGRSIRSNRAKKWILVDGSNVMHWEDNTPRIEPVRRVVTALKARGLDPGVVFDANVGWKLFGRYLGEGELGKMLNLPQDQVLVVPKGSPADPWLLTTARDYGAKIVTNDLFRDWAKTHPEVAQPGFLIHGGLSGDTVWLEGMPLPDGKDAP